MISPSDRLGLLPLLSAPSVLFDKVVVSMRSASGHHCTLVQAARVHRHHSPHDPSLFSPESHPRVCSMYASATLSLAMVPLLWIYVTFSVASPLFLYLVPCHVVLSSRLIARLLYVPLYSHTHPSHTYTQNTPRLSSPICLQSRDPCFLSLFFFPHAPVSSYVLGWTHTTMYRNAANISIPCVISSAVGCPHWFKCDVL